MTAETDRRETDRDWIMDQFREPWHPTLSLEIAMTVLKFAACGAGFAITLYVLSACSVYRDAQARKQIEEMHSTPWDEAMLESLVYLK